MSAHQQLAFACDPIGGVILAGDAVTVRCATCGQPVDRTFPAARIFKTGAITVFNAAGKQRYVANGCFLLGEGAR